MRPGPRYGNTRLVFDVDTGRDRIWRRRRRRKSRERGTHITRIYSNSITVNDYMGRKETTARLLRGGGRLLVAPVGQHVPTNIGDLIDLASFEPRNGWLDL